MSFKEISTVDAENTTAIGGTNRKTGKKNPTSAEGYFLGSKKVESKKAKSGYAFLHVLQTPKGNLGVWGKTDMDRKLQAVTPGTMIRITHTGMQATPNGEMYKFKVEVDGENTIEVAAPANSNYGSDDEGTESTSSYNDNDEEGPSYEAEEATQTATLSALERKAQVDALLKGGRSNRK